MLKLKLALALTAGLLSAATASADPVTLDFSAASGAYGASVNDLYNGGTDSAGAAGPNYGVSFSGSVLELPASDAFGPYFTNGPTANAIFANPAAGTLDVTAVMNVASGFAGSLGLSYASVSAPTTIGIYEGLGGAAGGSALLFSFVLDANSDGCAVDAPACVWTSVLQGFNGIAHSVDLTSNAGSTLFTNLSVNTVPLPGSALLMSFGLGLLGLFAARVRAA